MKNVTMTIVGFFALIGVSTAQAVEPSVFAEYELTKPSNNTSVNFHEVKLGAALNTLVGKVDGAVKLNYTLKGTNKDTQGYEFGYSNSVNVSVVELGGRLSVGTLTDDDGSTSLEPKFWAGEVGLAIPAKNVGTLGAFAKYRYRQSFDTPKDFYSNRYLVGLSTKLTKDTDVSVGYAYTTIHPDVGSQFNSKGMVAQVSYSF